MLEASQSWLRVCDSQRQPKLGTGAAGMMMTAVLWMPLPPQIGGTICTGRAAGTTAAVQATRSYRPPLRHSRRLCRTMRGPRPAGRRRRPPQVGLPLQILISEAWHPGAGAARTGNDEPAAACTTAARDGLL
uniref:Uncharacterized protein n=1 Tax=Setaria viridis TaxID=4556 RepID=A0A4U6UYW5_SETVI|nr:hypothetical protein SEVIR_4G151100v2 [Setaria viridis]